MNNRKQEMTLRLTVDNKLSFAIHKKPSPNIGTKRTLFKEILRSQVGLLLSCLDALLLTT